VFTREIAVPLALPERSLTDLEPTLSCYTSALDQASEALSGMLREPHGCFKQTSATNHPNVLIFQYFKQFPEHADPELMAFSQRFLTSG